MTRGIRISVPGVPSLPFFLRKSLGLHNFFQQHDLMVTHTALHDHDYVLCSFGFQFSARCYQGRYTSQRFKYLESWACLRHRARRAAQLTSRWWETSRERVVGWISFAGGSQRRGMTIPKLSLTGIVVIRASHRASWARPINTCDSIIALEKFQFSCSLESFSSRVSVHPVYSIVEVSLKEPDDESPFATSPISTKAAKPHKNQVVERITFVPYFGNPLQCDPPCSSSNGRSATRGTSGPMGGRRRGQAIASWSAHDSRYLNDCDF